VNAYTQTIGGALIAGGRLADIYGHRRLFVIGIALFTAASLACGLAYAQGVIIGARAVQGIGSAIIGAASLSLIITVFPDTVERAKALGVFGCIAACGGTIGLLLGGTLTGMLNWHWIFFVNVPIGTCACILCLLLVPEDAARLRGTKLDVGGALVITSALALAVYGFVNAGREGWSSLETRVSLACSAALFGVFVIVERYVSSPLIPAHIFRIRSFAAANAVQVLWLAGASAMAFTSVLYMQRVLGYTPLQVSLTYLPTNVITALFALGLSARVVARFGTRAPLFMGLTLIALALAWLSRVPVRGDALTDVIPSMILFGAGAGMAFNPLLIAAMSEVSSHEAGLASGVTNTVSVMSATLGLAFLASLSVATTTDLAASGATMPEALTGGYRIAFMFGACSVGTGAVLSALVLRAKPRAATLQPPQAASAEGR